MKKGLPSNLAGWLPAWLSPQYLLGIVCFCFSVTAFGQVHLVKDLNLNPNPEVGDFSHITDANGTAYYCYQGRELWRSDGTADGSVRIKRFLSITGIYYLANHLLVVANDSIHGPELWTSDGSISGTVMVKDINPGAAGSLPNTFCAVDDKVFFVAAIAKKGNELWVTDGTEAGTQMVKDIMKGAGNSNCRDLVSFHGKLYFVANNGTSGYEIHVSDGTAAGTHVMKEIRPGKLSSSPNNLTVSGDAICFMADDDEHGQELWKTDGTEEGTVLIKDIRPGTYSSFPASFVDCNGRLYFKANDGIHGFELWTSDGTADGTSLVKEFSPAKHSGFSWVNGMVNVDGSLFFILGRDIYKTDGTEASTIWVNELYDFYNTKEMAVVGPDLYLIDNAYDHYDLLKINKNGGTKFLGQVAYAPNGYYLPTYISRVGQGVFLTGNNNDQYASALMKSDGSPNGLVTVINTGVTITDNSYPAGLTDVNGTMYFNAVEDLYFSSRNLYKTNGTEAGTQRLTNFTGYTNIDEMYNYNGTVLMAIRPDWRNQLWRSDGTPEGTVMLKDFSPSWYQYPNGFVQMNGITYFQVGDTEHGAELWRTDGTVDGTTLVKDINTVGPYNPGSFPYNFRVVGNTMYFTADDGVHGNELWMTDGTPEGTVMVKDLTAGSTGSIFSNVLTANGQLYFTLSNGSLWRSDGTTVGTTPVTGVAPIAIISLMELNNSIYVVGYNPGLPSNNALWKLEGESLVKVHDFYPEAEGVYWLSKFEDKALLQIKRYTYGSSYEVWSTNGTADGTIKVADLGLSQPTAFSTTANGTVYFAPYASTDIYRTDGTTCGTYKFTSSGMLTKMRASGNNVYLSSFSELYGNELFVFDASVDIAPCSPSARVATSPNEDNLSEEGTLQLTNYPNPFSGHFVLNVGGTGKAYRAEIIHSNGTVVESHSELERNKDHKVGQQLVSGLYLVRVVVDGKTITRRVVKQN